MLRSPPARPPMWCAASWRHSPRYVLTSYFTSTSPHIHLTSHSPHLTANSQHAFSSLPFQMPCSPTDSLVHFLPSVFSHYCRRLRPPHGHLVQGGVHSRRNCVPEDQCGHRPSLQQSSPGRTRCPSAVQYSTNQSVLVLVLISLLRYLQGIIDWGLVEERYQRICMLHCQT